MQIQQVRETGATNRKHSHWGLLIPRPLAFLANSLMFGGGLLFAWLEGFGTQGGLILPSWLFVLLWFLVQELLVQQAKYMWNDSRDHERDQKILANSKRPLARQPLSTTTSSVMFGRWILGVVLAAFLSPVLLTVVLIITGLQIVYELCAKPYAAQFPTLPLFIVGTGTVLKLIGGCLAMGWPAGEQRLWLYGAALFATGVVYVSSFWRVEAAYFDGHKLPYPRGQSAYYKQKGMAWLKAGTAVTIVACTVLIFDGYTHFLLQTELSTGLALGLIVASALVCCQICFRIASGKKEIKYAAVALFIASCAGSAWYSVESLIPISNETFAAALLMLVLLIDHRLNYSMDYKQQNLIYLSENWPDLRSAATLRPQHPTVLIQWRNLLQLLLALNTANYQILRQQQRNDQPPKAYFNDADTAI